MPSYHTPQLEIPDDLDIITNELVDALSFSGNDDDQSEENLDFVLDIIETVAVNCSNDNVSYE